MGVMVFISSTVVAYLNLFNSLVGFISTYLFPNAALKQWFTLRMPKDAAFADYMMTFCGQRDAAWAILTVIELFFSDGISRNYLLASFLYGSFVACDIFFRVQHKCDAHGVAKGPVVFFCTSVGWLSRCGELHQSLNRLASRFRCIAS